MLFAVVTVSAYHRTQLRQGALCHRYACDPALAGCACSLAATVVGTSSTMQNLAVDVVCDASAAPLQAPVLLRLVFHDAGTYAATAGDGGANGSLRYELDRPENRGLKVAP